MSELSYVCMYHSYLEALEPFTDEERGRLLMAMLRFSCLGETVELHGNERYIWPSIRGQIQRDQQSYEKKCQVNRKNGQKGGRPRKNTKTEGFREEPSGPKEKEKEKKNKKENDKETENERENKKENRSAPAFLPPSVNEVRNYCDLHGFNVNEDRFVDFYTAKGWKMGSNPMEDWQAAVRTWDARLTPDPPDYC